MDNENKHKGPNTVNVEITVSVCEKLKRFFTQPNITIVEF